MVKAIGLAIERWQVRLSAAIFLHNITLQNKFVIRQIQKCPTAKYIVHLKRTVK